MKKIAIPTRENMVDDHFGHCAYYTVISLDDENQVQNTERLDSPEGCGCKSNIASVMQEMGTPGFTRGMWMQVKHRICHAGNGHYPDARRQHGYGSL